MLSVIALAVVACGNGGAGGTAELDGREFLSQSVDGHTLVAGTQVRLSFERREMRAVAGCNMLGAPYDVDDGRLVVRGDGMSMTDMGCDPPRHAQDEWLARFLQASPSIELVGDELTLSTADATLHLLDRVVADPDRPLVATRWRVDTLIDGDSASSVPPEHPVTLVFNDDGTLAAESEGCTSARLDVDVDTARHTLRFGDFAVDAIGCPSPWEATLSILRKDEARYSITASRLTITAGSIGIAARAY
jgi:heat shock protein HslJ